MSKKDHFDLCVIGAGPAGYAAAMRAIDFGKKVALIEKHKIGGAGIYNGALTSKTMWELSEKVAYINDTLEAHKQQKYEVSWSEVIKTLTEAVFEKKLQYSVHLKLLQQEKHQNEFSYIKGKASLLDQHTIQIHSKDNHSKEISADHIIIATGSRPRKLDHIQVDEQVIMTSDGIHSMNDYPKSLVILGAGVIGCEYATIFSNFGKTKVYLIDRADRILPFEDDDLAEVVTKSLCERGVTIHQCANLVRMQQKDGGVEYEIEHNKTGKREVIQVEKALLSIGRVPNIEHLGMNRLGLKMGKRGRHIGDDDTQTNIENIYAVGDVSGHIALVNVGEVEARHAVEKIYAEKTKRLSYDNVSTIMFLKPEVASVGVNEKHCVEQNINVRVVKLDYSVITRAIAMRSTEGFFKIIVTDDDEMKILGMRAIGAHASSAIQGVALLIKMNKGIEELAEMVHPHPSITEGIQECVRMLLKTSMLKPEVFSDKLHCYRLINGEKLSF